MKSLFQYINGVWTDSGSMKTGSGTLKGGMSFFTHVVFLDFAGWEGVIEVCRDLNKPVPVSLEWVANLRRVEGQKVKVQ